MPCPIDDDLAVQPRSASDVTAILATAAGLTLLALVALASGGSPWHGDGRQDLPAGVVSVLAAAAGVLVIGSLLLVWVGTPAAERRPRRRRPGTVDLGDLGASLSTGGRTAAIVLGAIGLFLLLGLPFFGPDRTPPPRTVFEDSDPAGAASASAPAPHVSSTSLTWLVVGSASALLLLVPAAVLVRRRRALREKREVVPDAAARIGSGLRRSLADLESEKDPRRAVRRAYAHMEESLDEVELARAPDETPSEFTGRVLRVLGASLTAASDLTRLFEIARFSDHPMDEDDRRQAITSVRRVEEEVTPP